MSREALECQIIEIKKALKKPKKTSTNQEENFKDKINKMMRIEQRDLLTSTQNWMTHCQ